MMKDRENTRSEAQDSHIRAAEFTALTALTKAAGQTAEMAFAAAMWTFTVIDAK